MLPEIIKIIFLILISILSIKYILFWTYVWQLKEYRLDRFRDFLHSREGRATFLNKFYLAKILFLILAAGLWMIRIQADIFYIALVIFIFIVLFFESVFFILRAFKNNFIKPVFTKKAVLLIFLSALISAVFFSGGGIFAAILTLVLMPFFAGIANLIIYPFSQFVKDKKVETARHIMEKFSGTVIGITGSYGKSSVKEFTAALLGKKFNILKTPKNVNTEIGVANYVSQKIALREFEGLKVKSEKWRDEKVKNYELNPPVYPFVKGGEFNFFICEMGAYRVGEIKKMCKMVKPKIGILTGINEQHLALFGSIENTIKAKSELIKSLPSDGLAIINWDDENCRKVKITAGIKKITYGFSEGADVRIKEGERDGEEGKEGREKNGNWKLRIGDEEIVLNCKLVGRHNMQNLLPAIIVAREAGMGWDEIKAIISELQPLDSGMKIKEINGVVIIDDTYNSNPTGIRSALEVLDGVDRKYKVLVLDDIWELGKEGQRIHRELAEEISKKNYDKIILVGKEYGDMMKKIMVENGVDEKRIILGGDRTLFYPDIVVLFEGRRANKFLIHLISNSSFGELRTSSNKISNFKF